jgi:hypothetical protein
MCEDVTECGYQKGERARKRPPDKIWEDYGMGNELEKGTDTEQKTNTDRNGTNTETGTERKTG